MGSSTIQTDVDSIVDWDPLWALLAAFKALIIGKISSSLYLGLVGRLQGCIDLHFVHLQMLFIEWRLLRLIHLILLSRLVLSLWWLLVFLWRLSHHLIFYRLLVIVLRKLIRLLLSLVHGRSRDAHLIYLVYWLSLRLVYVVILLLNEPIVELLLILRMLGMHWHWVSLVQAQRRTSAILKDVAWVRAHLRRFVCQV